MGIDRTNHSIYLAELADYMANSSDTGRGTLLAVAAIAFFVGRFSVGDKEPPAPTTQQFMTAPAADETFA